MKQEGKSPMAVGTWASCFLSAKGMRAIFLREGVAAHCTLLGWLGASPCILTPLLTNKMVGEGHN